MQNIVYYTLASHFLLVANNPAKSLRYAMKAHVNSHAPSSALLGFLFEFGLGVEKDYCVAERLYIEASRLCFDKVGLTESSDKGVEQEKSLDIKASRPTAAKTRIKQTFLSRNKSTLAQTRLVFLKTHGRHSVKINLKIAKMYQNQLDASSTLWFHHASALNLPAAQFCLGICYYNGIGLIKDHSLAFFWIRRAAESGLAVAMNVLGNLYVEGHGVVKDALEGLTWYIQAAEMREAAAIYNIGTLFERGLAVDTNLSKALEWYRRASVYGSISAENIIGIFCEQDGDTNAAKHYSKAAVAGHPHGCYNLGRCYHDGFGIERDDGSALEWFELAADQGHVLAQISAAIAYEKGLGTRRNYRAALHYYKNAAANGSDEAKLRLLPILSDLILSVSKVVLNDISGNFALVPNEILIDILLFLRPEECLSEKEMMDLFHVAKGRKRLDKADIVRRKIDANVLGCCSCRQECTRIAHVMLALEECDLRGVN